MILSYPKLISLFVLPFVLALLFTPAILRLSNQKGYFATPREDRWHKRPVPHLGGLAIFFPFMISQVLLIDDLSSNLIFLIGATWIFGLGLWDDIRSIPPVYKLIGQILAAGLIVGSGQYFLPQYPYLGVPVTLLWIVGITNAFNLVDNMDGLAAGISFIASLAFFSLAFFSENGSLGGLSLLLAGATLGFLVFNFPPAKIFMGDCGSMFLGFSLAVLSLYAVPSLGNTAISVAVLGLIFAVPLLDTVFVTINRLLHHRPIFQGGKDHTSHGLVGKGLSERQAVLIFFLISILCGGVGILVTRT